MTNFHRIGGVTRAAAVAGLAGALTFAGAGVVPSASAADAPTTPPTSTPSTPAPAGTLTGKWTGKCDTIEITSAGWPSDYKVQVRRYKDTKGTDEVVEYAPVNTTWTKAVGNQYRGFSFRIADAAGNWVTPLKEQASSCVVIGKPTLTAEATDCHTIAVSAKANAEVYVYAVTGPDGTTTRYPLSTTTIPAEPGSTVKIDLFWPAYTYTPDTKTVTVPECAVVPTPEPTTPPVTTPPTTPPVTPPVTTPPVTPPVTTPPVTTPPVTPPVTTPPVTPPVTTPPVTPPVTTPPVIPPVTTPPMTPPVTQPGSDGHTRPDRPQPPRPEEPELTRPDTRPDEPELTRPDTKPGTPIETRPDRPATRMVTRTYQVDRYRPRTAAQARRVARLDDDRRLGYREDRPLWGASDWQFVTVRVPVNATPAQLMKAINAKTSRVIGDVRTTDRLGSARAGRGYTVAWELGRGATPAKPWGARNATPQRFVARG